MLTVREVQANSDHAQKVEELFVAAFPPQERVPEAFLTEQALRDEVSLLAYYDDDTFCGFTFMIENQELVYVLYLAVEDAQRSQGYGASILAYLEQRCAGKTLTLDIEPVDPAAPNNPQRVRRRGFYLRNGFQPTGYVSCFEGESYEVLMKGSAFDPERFLALINELPEGEDKTVVPLEHIVSPFSGKNLTMPPA